ncbi:hypothetical protein CWI38_0926p0030 [Hamiltosporidium tvaerminnensis]|uniref:Uncharacterized protein n=1 Tax=Hamiltosporidium tvaerminnensis TaxID=1176355 RepID=A0A4Q9LTT1_9MICR|nr:hypothetical protein CWI38_0926p0030 [Hamiltosporidium tvaerminnensis]
MDINQRGVSDKELVIGVVSQKGVNYKNIYCKQRGVNDKELVFVVKVVLLLKLTVLKNLLK